MTAFNYKPTEELFIHSFGLDKIKGAVFRMVLSSNARHSKSGPTFIQELNPCDRGCPITDGVPHADGRRLGAILRLRTRVMHFT
jgi:hypothetical protein